MGCLRGAGDVRFTTFTSMLTITIVRPIMAYLLCYVLDLGLIGMWYAILVDQALRLFLTQWRFNSGKWMKIKI